MVLLWVNMKKQLFLKNLETIFLALASEIKNLTMISCPSASMSGWESSGLSYVQGFDAAPINKRNEGCKNCMFQVFNCLVWNFFQMEVEK
ncbi:uncharacterized protein LOC108197094 isoform X4 [Daucus carota subsp. sativus]|uniref:uncharacterized protein LOC108197094 isoform X4 n=2 Tax=Daucus carota subsp. sativus TaxID=79200 RepID=UPI003083C235